MNARTTRWDVKLVVGNGIGDLGGEETGSNPCEKRLKKLKCMGG